MSTSKDESSKLKLVDVAELEALIERGEVLDAKQKEYLRKRWLHQIRWWDKRAWEARSRYFALRVAIVIGGVLLPFLTTVSFSVNVDTWLRRLAAAISVLVAACAALEALYGWGNIWLEKRRAAEVLKVEGWLFLDSGGKYKTRSVSEAFPDFVTEVERQIASEVGEYVTQRALEQSSNSGRSANGEPEAT